MSRINAQRLMADLRSLAEFGKFGTGVDRISFSPADLEARAWLLSRMREAGLDAAIDSVGNVRGVTKNASRAVVIGSHTDSVPKGGWLDGAMGVVYGLEIARSRLESGRAARLGVDVVSFQDEEGSYFPCLGSRSFCGELTEEDLGRTRTATGESIREAIARAGYAGGAPWCLDRARHVAFLEAHIEQGPRLEAEKSRIGVVTGIVGIRRLKITSAGQADHAGTTPMTMRKDAVRPLLELGYRVHAEFPGLSSLDTVWNIGSLLIQPGAANVVPSSAEMILEWRDTSVEKLDQIEATLMSWISDLNRQPRVELTSTPIARIRPTLMAEPLQTAIEASARAERARLMRMPSGAGHDAMVVGHHLPAGMIFIPSIGGRSHDIVEDTSEEDIVLGCEVMAGVVDGLEAV
jgi:N-carbamoyl-L-amino-acid hydrolase